MGLSGIGVVAFFDLSIGLMVKIEDLTIYRNSITDCAQQIPAGFPDSMLDQVGYGGIALVDCDNAIIQENRLENNGSSHIDPICGIFILDGEKIDISNNRILNNGSIDSDNNNMPKQGYRGGIVIPISKGEDSIPAVKVHGNVVTQPFGRALIVVAVGPVFVADNQFTSQRLDEQTTLFGLTITLTLGGAVFIFNLGLSQEIVESWLYSGAKNLARTSLNQPQAIKYDSSSGNVNIIQTQPNYLLFWPSGKVIFNDNQTTLNLRDSKINISLSSQFIFSLDDISFSSNQSDCNLLADWLIANTLIIGFSVRTNNNRFKEGLVFASLSLFSLALINNTSNNQGSHCFTVLGLPGQGKRT